MQTPKFYLRHRDKLQNIFSILLVLGFYFLFAKIPPVNQFVNTLLTPVVAGMTTLYGKISTPIYRATEVNLGFVQPEEDPEFEFRVRVAKYINEKNATPLVAIAVNPREDDKKRLASLEALLKFERTEDWIQPFLNELYKGGMVGLYEEKFPLLEELMGQVRAEGGIQNSLVRAYAEVVLSFMAQVPDQPVVRSKALHWANDLLAEDALFIMIPRIEKETDESVRNRLQSEMIKIRAVSDHEKAKKDLIKLFRNPPWENIKTPVAVVLARTGFSPAQKYLRKVDLVFFPSDEIGHIRAAMAGTRYARELSITRTAEIAREKAERARQEQYEMALAKQAQIEKEEREKREKEMMLAKAEEKPEEKQAPMARLKEEPAAPASVEEAPVVDKTVRENPEPVVEKEMEKAPPAPEKPVEEAVVVRAKQVEEKKAQIREHLGIRETGYINVQFTAGLQAIPLYNAPGFNSKPMGIILDRGEKGRATYRTLNEGRAWFYVRTRVKAGWAPGFLLTLHLDQAKPAALSKKGEKIETTFFKPAVENAPVFENTDEKSQVVANLDASAGYLATRSRKEGPHTWFFIQVDDSTKGWVRGIDLRLADLSEVDKVAVPAIE